MIRIVVGPPAGGKNTYVAKYRSADDVVVDQDALNMAFGGEHRQSSLSQRAVAYAARSAAVGKICSGVIESDAWIIHGKPSPAQVEYYGKAGARFVVCAPSESEVLKRAGEDGRPAGTEDLIKAWYENPPEIPEAWIEKDGKEGKKMQSKQVEALIKADEAGLEEGQFVAYASTFDREPDSYGDVVAKGAFAKSLEEWEKSGNVIPVLFGHRMDDPDFNIGAVLKAEEDEHGLKITGQLDLDSPKGLKTYKLIKGRRLSQLSFAFDVLDEGSVKLEDGTKANELRELKLYEVSLVPIGANQNTEILAMKTAVDVFAQSVKAGRTFSAKNEESIRQATEASESVAATLKDLLAQISGEEEKQDSGASTPAVVEPEEGKAVDGVSVAQNLLTQLELAKILHAVRF